MTGIPVDWAIALPLLGTFVGYASAVGAEVVRGRESRRLAAMMYNAQRAASREDRLEARDQSIVDRREAFELDHLLQVNAALGNLARAVHEIHLIDSRAAKTTGRYASTLIGDKELDRRALDCNRRVADLEGLVLDDQVRQLVIDAHTALNVPGSMLNGTLQAAERAMEDATLTLSVAQVAIAQRVRDIYRRGAPLA